MKRFLKSPWTIGIATTLLGFFLSVGYDLLKGKQVLTTVGTIFSKIWSWILTFMTFNLKVWWVLLGIASLFLIIYHLFKTNKQKEQARPEYTSYTQDHFRSWKWSWSWEWNSDKKEWNVVNLQARCPKCDTPMNPGLYEDYYQCPRCGFQSVYDNHDKSYEVEAVIIDNLNRQREERNIEAKA